MVWNVRHYFLEGAVEDHGTGTEILISGEHLTPAAYQAVYHKLTSKTERIQEVFYEAYEITFSDLRQLYTLMEQTVSQYHVKGKNCELIMSLHKGETYSFSSFERASIFNFSSRCPTTKIVMEYDFFTILPINIPEAKDIVQRFKVSIQIDQDFIEESILESRVSFYRPIFTGENISLIIEYANYSVARALQSTIQTWVAGLRSSSSGYISNMISRNSDDIHVSVPRIMFMATLIGAYVALTSNMLSSAKAVAELILITLSVATFFYTFGIILTSWFLRLLHLVKPLTFIRITQGDEDRYQRYALRRTARKRWIGFIVITVLVSLGVNLASSFIFEWLKG